MTIYFFGLKGAYVKMMGATSIKLSLAYPRTSDPLPFRRISSLMKWRAHAAWMK